MSDYELIETKFGFKWGPFVIERECSDPKGGLSIKVRNNVKAVQIRSSPKGNKLQLTERPLYPYELEEAKKG